MSSPYYTNKSTRAYIDRRLKILQEQLNPELSASDYKKGDDQDLEEMRDKLMSEIKLKDPEFYAGIDIHKDKE